MTDQLKAVPERKAGPEISHDDADFDDLADDTVAAETARRGTLGNYTFDRKSARQAGVVKKGAN